MFDHLHVQAYGKSTPLSEVGQVTIKSPTLAVINVYDPEVRACVRACVRTRSRSTTGMDSCHR